MGNDKEMSAKKRKKSSSDDVDEKTDDHKKAKSSSTSPTATPEGSTKVVPTYEERCLAVNAICYPLANKKSTKKCHKLVRKASSMKHIRRGVKEVIKAIRKGENDGLVILAGDIYPIDVISHIPLLLEEKNIPYIFVPSKFDLGAAASTKRPTSCVLIRTPKSLVSGKKKSKKDDKSNDNKEDDNDFQELYDTLYKEAMEYDPSTIMK